MKFLIAFILLLASLALTGQTARAAGAPADLVQQVQAANLLSDLITYTVDRADARMTSAQAFLTSIGKADAFNQAKPNPPMPRPLNYMLLFKGSLQFVEGDGKKFADPSVANEQQPQLYQELTAAQYYNMHEFLHFNEQRQAFASVHAYLESIGQYQKYLDSEGAKSPVAQPPATQPTPTTPDEVAKRLGDLITFIHETAWKEAQAKGTSQTDFEKQWPEQVKQYRLAVQTKVEGSQPSAGAFGQSDQAGSAPPPPSTPAPPPPVHYQNTQTDLGANRTLPPTVESPYSNANYRAKDTSLWNMWDYDQRF